MTQPISHIKKDTLDNDNTVVTDKQIEEILPKEEEFELNTKPLSEAEAEEAVGGDMPVEGLTNLNTEDEEVEKEADFI